MELNFAGIVCDLSMLTEIVSMPLEAQTAIAPTSGSRDDTPEGISYCP